MAHYILCPECGFCVGKYYEFIDLAKHAQNLEFKETSKFSDYKPDKIQFATDAVPTLEGIFDALDIEKRCCRMHIMGKTEFDKMYK